MDNSRHSRWIGWRKALALAAGFLALAHACATVFDDKHNGGSGLSIVLALMLLAAVTMGQRAAPWLAFCLAITLVGRLAVRFHAGAPFDLAGLIVAAALMTAGLLLRRSARSATT